jgi:2-oxoglutarate ferredoxin oxidoreductase subunit delta
MAGRITIDFERCKGCGLCVAVCPKASIGISKKANKSGYLPAETSNNNCTGCAACALICPDAAIIVYRDDKENSKSTKAQESKNSKRISKQ